MVKRTLLIVDDQALNRRFLKKILSDEYEILEADNGENAMAVLRCHSEEISAMILDIVMPVLDGYSVLSQMNEDPILSKIPVIVTSQMDGDDAEIQALSLGAQDFIPKPYKAKIIRHRLSNTIRLRETAAIVNRMVRDEMTGLYNKQIFLEKAAQTLDQHPDIPYDMLCIGIERFRLIIDTFGQERGDALIRHMARVLKEVKSENGLCARFETGEFYLLFPHADTYSDENFKKWSNRVNDFDIDMDIRMYCGVYMIEDMTLPVLTMCAYARMAAENNEGKYNQGFTYYDDSIRQKLLEEEFISRNMQSALDQHQFKIYYQPKYDLSNENVAGAEALVRWKHPEKGLISPDAFIPLFEKNGFIIHLDLYVWESVCSDIRDWMDRGLPPLAISVNVSRSDLFHPKLSEFLLQLIAKYEIPIKYLHLEITESAYTNNEEQIIGVVQHLRDLGFLVEMDDFGSGYSSLNMLAQIPVNVLKLDMRFIQHETAKSTDRGILSFVISLAKWLNLAVVAEGVETREQIAILRSMDCNYVQGFYFAKPLMKDEFEILLKTAHITEMICENHRSIDLPKDESQGKTSSKKEILIVDDVDLNRAILAKGFSGEYQIVEKENGREAWEYLQTHYENVEAVLLDLLMPVMDGYQVLTKIRNDDNMQFLPVIIESQGDKECEKRALKLQADDFISKPYELDAIRRRVKNAVESCQWRRYQLTMSEKKNQAASQKLLEDDFSKNDVAWEMIHMLRPHFDIVRLVDAQQTKVHCENSENHCDTHACFSVWNKSSRCQHCISQKAMQEHKRLCKLESNGEGLYFVISEYVPYGESGAVIEMVTKLPQNNADHILGKYAFS